MSSNISKFYSNSILKWCKQFGRFQIIHISSLKENEFSGKAVPLAHATYQLTKDVDKVRGPIIVCHGLLGSKTNWNTAAKALATKTSRKIVVADARNHGHSPHTDGFSYELMAEDIRLLLQQLSLKHDERVSLIGHSMGGRTAMMYALKYPDTVESLVVVDILPVGTTAVFDYLPKILNSLKTVKLKQGVTLPQAREAVDVQLKDQIKSDWLRKFVITNIVQTESGDFAWRININSLSQNVHLLRQFPERKAIFHGPTLFIAGAMSDFVKQQDEPQVLKQFPRAEFHYVQGAGHVVHIDKPEEFINAVSQFLQKNKK